MRSIARVASLALAAAVLLATTAAHAAPRDFEGTFTGLAEAPPNASPGTGTALATYDEATHLLTVDLVFSGLLAPTTAAHIHCCAPANTGAGVAIAFNGFPIGVTSGSYQNSYDLSMVAIYNAQFINARGGSVALAEADLVAGLANGTAYYNIHSTQLPGGEIRVDMRAVDGIFGDGFE